MITIVEYNKEEKQPKVLENVNWREFQMKQGHAYWWDLGSATPEESASLSEYFHFHPLAVEDCLADVHHPKVYFYETYLYMVVHGVDVDLTEIHGFAPKELDVFLGTDLLVTFHKKDARSIQEIMRRLRENVPLLDYGLDFVLYSILDLLVTHYSPVLDTIEEELEIIEDHLFIDPKPEVLRRILQSKRTIMSLKKTVFPQREVINHLARNEYQFVQRRTQAYFRDVYDMLYRMAEMTESFRDISTALVETYLSTVSNRMNEVMKVLTLFATVFMAISVITGIYGMNFVNMPELKWENGYFFTLGIMGVVALALGIYFKWKKWL